MPRAAVDHTGKRYGSLVALYRTDDPRRAYWMCQCDCGKQNKVRASRLLDGTTMSCGCARSRLAVARMTRHGHTKGNTQTYLHKAWTAMRGRCGNPNASGYEYYGARGISVCARWEVFENFAKDMGERPSQHHSLDRIDVNGNYEPGNCRWATDVEQNRNKTNNRILEFCGKSQPLTAWAEEVGIPRNVIFHRLDNLGWSVERALTEPKRPRKCA